MVNTGKRPHSGDSVWSPFGTLTSFVLGNKLICPVLDVLFPSRQLLLALGDSCQSNRGLPRPRVIQQEYTRKNIWWRLSPNEAVTAGKLLSHATVLQSQKRQSFTSLFNLIKEMVTILSMYHVTPHMLTQIAGNVWFASWCIYSG